MRIASLLGHGSKRGPKKAQNHHFSTLFGQSGSKPVGQNTTFRSKNSKKQSKNTTFWHFSGHPLKKPDFPIKTTALRPCLGTVLPFPEHPARPRQITIFGSTARRVVLLHIDIRFGPGSHFRHFGIFRIFGIFGFSEFSDTADFVFYFPTPRICFYFQTPGQTPG